MERPVVFPLLLVSVAPLHVGRAAADPRRADAANFSALFARPFWRWFGNTLLIAGTAAVLNVVLCALGAYAFSRLRFSGRRAGLLTVLLVQMFPQLLAMVALFLLMIRVGDVFPAIGSGTRLGLIFVYLGGALGVNTWLMKGFFDTIPRDLDESAVVDGATHAQIFFRIILPLVRPVLAVVGLLAFVFIVNDFVVAQAVLPPGPSSGRSPRSRCSCSCSATSCRD